MKVLIIDDNVFKTNDIKKALESLGAKEILKVNNQEDAFVLIYEAKESNKPFDLIVTDMHYPVKKNQEANTEAGFIFIERMKKENIEIPIIICSSLNFEAPDALGVVWYSKIRDLREDFMEVIKGIR